MDYLLKIYICRRVARIEEIRNVSNMFIGKLEGKRSPEDLDVDVRTILKWILQK
jgi:hypothetical protein